MDIQYEYPDLYLYVRDGCVGVLLLRLVGGEGRQAPGAIHEFTFLRNKKRQWGPIGLHPVLLDGCPPCEKCI